MKIGQKLKEKRTAAGMSQEALSERIGISRQTISSWENDRSYPDIGSILKLSDLYGISLDELLKEDENMRKHVEKASAFSEQLWTYLFVLTILLIPMAIVLERCLNASTAAQILTLAAMVIMPFLLNVRRPIFGEDKVINVRNPHIYIDSRCKWNIPIPGETRYKSGRIRPVLCVFHCMGRRRISLPD